MQPVRQDLKTRVKTFDGEKEYIFCALKRKDAARVFHNTISAVVSAVADVSISEGKSQTDAVFRALRTLDFDSIWGLAEVLLRFAILDGHEIDKLEDTDYFEAHPEELYLAVFHAVLLNYPGVFGKLKNVLSGLDLGNMVTGLGRETSETV